MKRLISSIFILGTTAYSIPSVASNDTCAAVAKECENAVALAKALSPYMELAKHGAAKAYTIAHAGIDNCISDTWVNIAANPYLSNEWMKSIAIHGVMGASVALVSMMVTNALAVPLFFVKLPFRNRVTMFASGIAAKACYDYVTRS